MEASSSTAQQNSTEKGTLQQYSYEQYPKEMAIVKPIQQRILEAARPDQERETIQKSRQMNINDQVSVDIIALTMSLIEEFKRLRPLSRERCIYRVPKRLKVLNEKAYTPQYVSIGPYHHGKNELKAMEEHKIMYLQHFLRLSKVSLEAFALYVRSNETRLRNYYQERIEFSSGEFVRLMLVDAAFVIMVMLKSCHPEFRNEDELLFNNPWMINGIKYDMILLENQLPFFLLHEFLVLSNYTSSMLNLSYHFLRESHSWVVNPSEEFNLSECKHLVDFLRIGQKPLEQNKHKALDVLNLPSAVELHRAGVKFKHSESLRLVDINFRNGILEIPLLKLTDHTEILFRNVLAFEESHIYSNECYFNDYITMINLLVTNGNDVEILTKDRIIETWLHQNEEVVHLLRNLDKENLLDSKNFYFTDVVNDLNQYCRKRRNRWRTNLIQTYFHNPWAVISVIAATFVILLTIVQTICSILQAARPDQERETIQKSRQMNINDQVSVDITALTVSLIEEFKRLRALSRVPKRLRVLNEKAYTPQYVLIGPYHHGKNELKVMEEHKIMYLQHFLRLSEVSLETFALYVGSNETRLRNYYQERIEFSSGKFVRLMLVDAAFVIMVMLRSCHPGFFNEDDLLFNKPWMINGIKYNMILLENQLPFYLLHEFLVLSNYTSSMLNLSSHFLRKFNSWVVNPSEELNLSECKHLVDFLRIGQKPLEQNKHKALDVLNLPSAVELHRAGVKFKHSESLRLVDINFRNGILKIPSLKLTDHMEILFRNVQAFEESHIYSNECYFNDYITMINLLVTNGNDVEILTKDRIIETWLNQNEEVVHLLRNLDKENLLNSKNFYFTDVVNDLNQYCRKRRNRWRTNLIHMLIDRLFCTFSSDLNSLKVYRRRNL